MKGSKLNCSDRRGHPEDYAAWVRAGAAGWDFCDVQPVFQRIEHHAPGPVWWKNRSASTLGGLPSSPVRKTIEQQATRYVIGPDAAQLIAACTALDDRARDAVLAAFMSA